ncbi:MAG: toxin [Thermomicrobiales bacterium]|nr:MAG: toxin [Thermomicrobiales bacterium]
MSHGHTIHNNAIVNIVESMKKKDGLGGVYRLQNFFHPQVSSMIDRLSRSSLKEALDPDELNQLSVDFFESSYEHHGTPNSTFKNDHSESDGFVSLEQPFPKLDIDIHGGGPYANYNWEVLFHIPVGIAVHLTKTQRFAEAQRWFHLVFDPTDPAGMYWRSLAMRGGGPRSQIDALLRLLSASALSPAEIEERTNLLAGYSEIMRRPFQPFAVARTRLISFQFMVVMRYLDNLLAWGDSLFAQDTSETVSEATQIYVLGSTLLGTKPQQVPTPTTSPARTYKELKQAGLNVTGNAMVQLESLFPFNYGLPQGVQANAGAAPLFGLARSLYFCIPRNDKLLRYWDDFADRLGKIRAGMNLQGAIRRLALFDPPIDPALLVRAAASGIDVGAAVAGLNKPFVPVRAALLLQRAIELAGEVRSLGGAALSAMEKRDAEDLALMRQGHELRLLQTQREIRLLQWKQAEEATEALLRTRASTLDRYSHYLRQLGETVDASLAPDRLPLRRSKISEEITEERFDELYIELVQAYDRSLPQYQLPRLRLANSGGAASTSGAQGSGKLFLTQSEHKELNELLPEANDLRRTSFVLSTLASVLVYIPDFDAKLAFWGMGAGSRIFGGQKMSDALNTAAQIISGTASLKQDEAAIASRTASYERRADDWMFQANQAARELSQQGRQLIASLIAEQAARREYENVSAQLEDSNEVKEFLNSKFTGQDLYHWMQGELSRLHREYFDFAVYTARKAESAVKNEVMRPELDSSAYIGIDYWDSGRRGLLAGEALHLDLKRLELAYLEANKYEDPLTKHVSLRRLDPVALLTLQATGKCDFRVPEWLFDIDRPGHYMRRIRRVGVMIPAVVGPNANLAVRVTLLGSSLRRNPGGASYPRQGSEDPRFVDFTGAIEVTLPVMAADAFESPSARDQLLPFEGHGAVDSHWRIELPGSVRQFDYASIADVVLQLQYTARSGGDTMAGDATTEVIAIATKAATSPFAIVFSVADEFPAEWAAFTKGNTDLQFVVTRDMFPYITEQRTIKIKAIQAHVVDGGTRSVKHGTRVGAAAFTGDLNDQDKMKRKITVSLPVDAALTRNTENRPYVVIAFGF